MLRTGFEPATDNRNRSGPQPKCVAVVSVQSVAESNRSCQITGPLRPATISFPAGPPGVEPGPARLELAVLPFTPRAFESGRPESNRPLRGGSPVLFRLSYVREVVRPAGIEPASCRRRAALSSSELRAFVRSLRQESNPHLGRTKGACLPFTLRRLEWRRRESNPLLLGASEVLYQLSYIPEVRTDGVEPSQPGAPRLQRSELAKCSASARNGVTGRARTGAAGITTPDASVYTTATIERGRPDSNRRPLA